MSLSKENIIKYLDVLNLLSAFSMLSSSVFSYNSFIQYSLYLFFVTYFLPFFIESRYKQIRWKKQNWVFVSMIFYFLLTIFYYPIESDLSNWGRILEHRLPLFAFALVGILGTNQYFKVKNFAYFFIINALLLNVYVLVYKLYFIENLPIAYYNPTFIGVRSFLISTHMKFNLYMNLAIVAVFYLIKIEPVSSKAVKLFLFVFGIGLYFVIMLSDGRQGQLMVNVILFLMFAKLFYKKYKLLLVLISVIILSGAIFYVSRSNKGLDARMLIWNDAIETVKNNPVIGYGSSSAVEVFHDKLAADDTLMTSYVTDPIVIFAVNKKSLVCTHAHNQLLQSMIEFGVIGLLTILSMLLLPMFFSKKGNRFVTISISVIFAGQLMTDVFVAGMPLITYSLVLVLLLNLQPNALEKRAIITNA